MLSVKAVLDVVAYIDLVDHLVSVFLKGRCEDHDLIVLGHRLNELDAARSHEEKAVVLVLNIVNECLVEIEHQTVRADLCRLQWVQERGRHLGQVRKVVREHG